jgi:hypothetical protein
MDKERSDAYDKAIETLREQGRLDSEWWRM